jgi:YD repeat-containing protein
MMDEIKEYNRNGDITYHRYIDGIEAWYKYDEKNNLLHHVNTRGHEIRVEYDYENMLMKVIRKGGSKFYYILLSNDMKDKHQITRKEFEGIKEYKEFLSRKEISRFELLDI